MGEKKLLVVRNLKKYFPLQLDLLGRPHAYLRAVDDVSFTLDAGKTLGIVGESGCGKTTLGRTVLRLYSNNGGEILFDGQDINRLGKHEMQGMRTRMQLIFQDPYSSLSPRLTVGEIIGEAVAYHRIVPASQVREYVLDVMEQCGLQPHYYGRYPHEFSGGQRQRICIARSLALQPDFVVCDEPVSALDVSIQAQIINLLKKLQAEKGMAYLFISHDLSVVRHISDDVGVMYLGSMVEKGAKDDIFTKPLHPYTQALFSAVPNVDPRKKMERIILQGDIPSPANPPSGCKFHTRCDKCKEICKREVPAFRNMGHDHFVACHLYDGAGAEDDHKPAAEAGTATEAKPAKAPEKT